MKLLAALTSGLAVKQSVRGAQVQLVTAGRRLPLSAKQTTVSSAEPSACHGLRVGCSNPPNAIKVGASSDREQC